MSRVSGATDRRADRIVVRARYPEDPDYFTVETVQPSARRAAPPIGRSRKRARRWR